MPITPLEQIYQLQFFLKDGMHVAVQTKLTERQITGLIELDPSSVDRVRIDTFNAERGWATALFVRPADISMWVHGPFNAIVPVRPSLISQ